MSGTVWLVTYGEYSDYRVEAVFTTEKKAEAYADALNRAHPRFDDYFVEERDLDPETPVLKRIYEVTVNEQGDEVDRRELEVLADSLWARTRAEYDHALGYSTRKRLVGCVGVSERGFEVALKAARDELHRAKAHGKVLWEEAER